VIRDARLDEIDQGAWEGLRPAEIIMRWPDLHAHWEREPLAVHPPGGEPIGTVEARVLAALADIARTWAGQTVCIVAHKISIAVLRAAIIGIPLAVALEHTPANASVERLTLARLADSYGAPVPGYTATKEPRLH
jgi:broad specificity phosphatase PhoE